MKKRRAWLIVLAPFGLGGLAGFPGFPTIFTRTTMHYPPDYADRGSRVTTTICRGVPIMWESCEVRMRQLPADTETGLNA